MQQATVNLLVRHGRPARDAPVGPDRGRRAGHDRAHRDHHRSRRAARPCRAATSRSPVPPPTPAALVAAVEVSTDGGTTWGRATGTTSWTYTFSAATGPVTVAGTRRRRRGQHRHRGQRDLHGRRRRPARARSSRRPRPATEEDDTNAVELGVKFRSDVAGFITGIRFYKTLRQHRDPHRAAVVDRRARTSAPSRSPASPPRGWQEATFDAPVAIDADTTYVASYHTTVRPLRRSERRSPPPASTTRRCTRCRTASTGQRRLPLRRRRRLPDAHVRVVELPRRRRLRGRRRA